MLYLLCFIPQLLWFSLWYFLNIKHKKNKNDNLRTEKQNSKTSNDNSYFHILFFILTSFLSLFMIVFVIEYYHEKYQENNLNSIIDNNYLMIREYTEFYKDLPVIDDELQCSGKQILLTNKDFEEVAILDDAYYAFCQKTE